MDLSKLPKMSQTPPPPPEPQAAPPAQVYPQYSEPSPRIGGDAWFSIAIGAIALFMMPRFLHWVLSQLFGTHFNPFLDGAGNVVPYPQTQAFWTDLGPTLFGIVLIVEGITMILSRRPMVILFGFALTVIATAYNALYLVLSFSTYGFALMSALAVVFGIYIARYQWQMLHFAKAYRA